MRFCSMALVKVWVTCSCPTTSAKRCGRYFRAMTWYDMPALDIGSSPRVFKQDWEGVKSQGDHGRCRANYRCCIPALAGFVSPHSVGPGGENVAQGSCAFKENYSRFTGPASPVFPFWRRKAVLKYACPPSINKG